MAEHKESGHEITEHKEKSEHKITEQREEAAELFEDEESAKRSTKFFISLVIAIILIIVAIFVISKLTKEKPLTIDDLHKLNLEGKLEPEDGIVYNGFSFVYLDGLWYTQYLVNDTLYEIPLRYNPEQVKDITAYGSLNKTLFNQSEIYVTFDPLKDNLKYTALAAAELSLSMSRVINANPVASCTLNETDACKSVPIVTCEDKEKPVIYLKEAAEPSAIFGSNCITLQGPEMELLKAVDRLIFHWLKVIPVEA